VDYLEPPSGRYHMTLVLAQYNGREFVIADARSFSDQVDLGGGGGGGGNPTRTAAELQTPANGTTLSGSCVTLRWNAADGASEYWVEAGRSETSNDIFDRSVGRDTSVQVCGLPGNGSRVHVRLYTRFGSDWFLRPYWFVSGSSQALPQLLSPQAGATIGACTEFRWSSGSGADEYYIELGTSPASTEIFDRSVGRSLSQNVCNLPAGRTVHLRLWTRFGSDWQVQSYTFTVGGSVVQIAASPSVIDGCGSGTVEVLWNAPSSEEVQIRVNGPFGNALTNWTRGGGSARTGAWVTHGMQFFIVNRAGRTLGTTTVWSNCPGAARLSAATNPVTSCDASQMGATRIQWLLPSGAVARVKVGSTNGSEMTGDVRGEGSADTGRWVRDNMTFYLMSGSRVLASTVVGLNCR
jgi:hypothetical protein